MWSIPICTRRARAAAIVAALVAAGVFAPPARADIETATFTQVNPGEVVTITDSSLKINGESGWAGKYDFTNASGALGGSYSGFCIDIAQDISPGTYTWNVNSLANAPTPGQAMGTTGANLIAELWYNDYASIATSNSNAAAFQVAVWEIINGGVSGVTLKNGTLSNGTLSVTDSDGPTLSTAYNWLKALDASGNGPKASGLIALTSSTTQDYVVQTPAPAGSVYAVSGAVTLLLALAWRRRQVGRKADGLRSV